MKSAASNEQQKGAPATRNLRLVALFSILPIIALIMQVAGSPTLVVTAETIIVWVACLILLFTVNMLAEHVKDSLLTSYAGLAVMACWLTLGMGLALLLIIVTAITTPPLRGLLTRFYPSKETWRSRWGGSAAWAVTGGFALVVAHVVFTLLGGDVPLMNPAFYLHAVVALLVNLVVLHALARVLYTETSIFSENSGSVPERIARVLTDLALIGLAAGLPLILYTTSALVFVVIMLMLTGLAVRYWQIAFTQRSLMRRVHELSTLNTVGQMVSSKLLLDDLLYSLYTQVNQLIEVSTFYIALYDAEQKVLDFRLVITNGEEVQWPKRKLRPGGLHDQIIRKKTTLDFDSMRDTTARRLENTLVMQSPRAFIGVPLVTESEVVGVMAVISNNFNQTFDKTDARTLQTVANQAALAIRNATLYEQTEELAQRLALINQSMQNLMYNLDDEETMVSTCNTAVTIVNANRAAIYTLDQNNLDLVLRQSVGMTEEQKELARNLPYQPDLYYNAPRVVNDIYDLQESDKEAFQQARRGQYRAYAEIPLRSGSVIVGLLVVYHHAPFYYQETDLDLLSALANQVVAALDNAQLLQALELYASEMGQLMHLSRISTSSLQLDNIVKDIEEILGDMLNITQVQVVLRQAQQDRLFVLETRGDAGSETTTRRPLELPEFQHFIQTNMQTPRTYAVGDTMSAELIDYMTAQGVNWVAMLPMVTNNVLLGILLLSHSEPRSLTSREWQLLETATNQVATQIDNAQAYSITRESLNERLEQLSMIEDIARQIASALDFNEIINDLLEAALVSTHGDSAGLALLTEADDFWIINHQYLDGKVVKTFHALERTSGIVGFVARTGEPLLVPNNDENPHYTRNPRNPHLMSSIAVPLVQDERVIGVLNVESTQPDFFTPEQGSFLSNLAGHAVISIENARLLEERQHQVEMLTGLRELSLRLSSVVDTSAAAYTILDTALVMIEGRRGALYRHDETTNQISALAGLQVSRDRSTVVIPAQQLVPPPQVFRAIETGETQIEPMVSPEQDRWVDDDDAKAPESLIAVPIKRRGRVQEVLVLFFAETPAFQERDLNTLSLLTIQAAGHIENAQLHERIRSGHNRMRAILDSTRDGVILLDSNNHLIETNPAAQYLIGITLTDYIGKPFAEVLEQYTHRSADEVTDGEITQVMQLLENDLRTVSSSEFQVEKDGDTTYVEALALPVHDVQERAVGRLIVLRDITEEKLLEAYRAEITHMAVHDLRGPLASIINGVHLTRDMLDEPENLPLMEQTLDIALDNANKMMMLVNTMLDIAKLKKRELPLSYSRVKVDGLLQDAMKTLSPTMQAANIQSEIIVPDDLPLIHIDASKIMRVLVNLIDNALNYTPADSKIQVSATLQPDDEKVLFQVADSGPGIPEKDRERIFDDFVQIKDQTRQRGSKGTGLGLTFCKLAVEAHGGNIWVQPEGPLPGATLAFNLPIEKQVLADDESTDPPMSQHPEPMTEQER